MRTVEGNQRFIKYSTFSPFEKTVYYDNIYSFLKRLNIEYPGFGKWYRNIFKENRELKEDREIVICEKDYCIVGVAILKSTNSEKKICTLRVAKAFQKQGIGRKLMEMSFEWLQDDKPLITMHSTKEREFLSLINYYGFVLEEKQWNYYNIFSTELSYNGVLPEKKILFNQIELTDIDLFYSKFVISGRYGLEEFVDQCILKWYRCEKNRRIEILNY